MALVDPTTGRPVWSGPKGEAGSASRAEMVAYAERAGRPASSVGSYRMPDGRTAYYLPGINQQGGNLQALGLDYNGNPLQQGRDYHGQPLAKGADPYGQPNNPSAPPAAVKSPVPEFNAESAASIKNTLNQYGLSDLVPLVDQWVRDGLSWPEIEGMLRDPKSTPGKVFDAMYPEIRLRTEAGLQPLSVTQIQQYRTDAKALMRAAGLPSGFYDSKEDFTTLLVGDVSVSELNERINQGFVQVAQAPKEVRESFGEFFGVNGDAALAAYFLDADRAIPVLAEEVEVAKIGGASKAFGYNLNVGRARQVAGTNVSYEQARNTFSGLRTMDGLFEETITEATNFTAEQEGVDAAFGLDAGDADRKLKDRLGQRVAAGSGVGSAASGDRGVFGLGTAKR